MCYLRDYSFVTFCVPRPVAKVSIDDVFLCASVKDQLLRRWCKNADVKTRWLIKTFFFFFPSPLSKVLDHVFWYCRRDLALTVKSVYKKVEMFARYLSSYSRLFLFYLAIRIFSEKSKSRFSCFSIVYVELKRGIFCMLLNIWCKCLYIVQLQYKLCIKQYVYL